MVQRIFWHGKFVWFPAAGYFLLFAAMTFPRILQLSTEFFCDEGDGLQFVWAIWWIEKATTALHQSPWVTRFLSYPLEVSLHGATLNPINGFIAIPLLRVFDLLTVFNILVVASFVTSGVTAFLLAYRSTESYLGSLVAGFIFAFSPYRFAHAHGHLNLLTTQWLPVFFLLWTGFLQRPCVAVGIGAAGALFLVCLSDYYYLVYAMIGALVLTLSLAFHTRRPLFLLDRAHRWGLFAFAAASALTTGQIIRSFIAHNRVDPLTGRHNPYGYSLDPAFLVIPGAFWRFGELTGRLWSTLPVNAVESSVAVGVSVLALVCFTWWRAPRERRLHIQPWFAMFATFLLLACGPALHVYGLALPHIPLPYLLLMKTFPLFGISGIPERMVVVVHLAAGIVCAAGIELLRSRGRYGRAIVGLFLVILLVEYLPAPIPAITLPFTDYPQILRADSRPGALLDATQPQTRPPLALYYQTIHERPLSVVGRGATARGTIFLRKHGRQIKSLVDAGHYRELRDQYGVLYVLSNPSLEIPASYRSVLLPQLHSRGRLYDLSTLKAD